MLGLTKFLNKTELKMLRLLVQQIRLMRRSALSQTKSSAYGVAGSQQSADATKVLEEWKQKLHKAGVGDLDFNMKCLVAHVLKRKFNTVSSYNSIRFTDKQLKELERLCEARCARMPLQYILGEWDFMDLTLKTAPTVFIPRPETEEFVAKVIEQYRDGSDPVDMLEVGCGSGAISLAILHALPHIQSTAVERSKVATALAWENSKMLGLEGRFKVYNHTTAKDDYLPAELGDRQFDLIVSNPPYVRTEEFQHLAPEVVVYENINALNGGVDGLQVARLVFDLACLHLRPGGKLWLELGSEHPPLVKAIMNLRYENRLRFISAYKDQYERDRFVEIEKV